MFVNLIVISLILFIGYFYSRKLNYDSDYNRKKYIKIICFILILQSGLRNVAVGADTYAYFLWFEEIKLIPWQYIFVEVSDYYEFGFGKDPGYLVFQKLIQIAIGEYHIYLFIIALLFFTALGNFIYKNTTRLSDALIAFTIYSVLFYSFFSITGLRQTIATALALFSYELIKKKKFLPFVILIIMASSIHRSVLIFIPFYFISQIKNTKYLYIGIMILFPLFMYYKNDVGGFLKLAGGYDQYEQTETAESYTFTIMFALISIVAWWRYNIIFRNNSNASKYYVAFALALLFLPLTWVNESSMRIVQYFSIFMMLLVPEIMYSFQAISFNIRISLTRFVIIVLVSLYIKANLKSDLSYGFFWEDMKLGKNYLDKD